MLNDQIQVRPASAMGPVLSLFFGWPAIVGCALGNLVSDASWESDPALLAVYFLVQLAYNWLRLPDVVPGVRETPRPLPRDRYPRQGRLLPARHGDGLGPR